MILRHFRRVQRGPTWAGLYWKRLRPARGLTSTIAITAAMAHL